jgi:hypothetical protein
MIRFQNEQKVENNDATDIEAREKELNIEIESKQLQILGPILLGKSVLKAWGSLVSRVKFCNDAKYVFRRYLCDIAC